MSLIKTGTLTHEVELVYYDRKGNQIKQTLPRGKEVRLLETPHPKLARKFPFTIIQGGHRVLIGRNYVKLEELNDGQGTSDTGPSESS